MNEQISDTVVQGARFMDEYLSRNGMTWILAGKDVNCDIDLIQSALISYSLELGLDEEKIKRIVSEMEGELAYKRADNPLVTVAKDLDGVGSNREAGSGNQGRDKNTVGKGLSGSNGAKGWKVFLTSWLYMGVGAGIGAGVGLIAGLSPGNDINLEEEVGVGALSGMALGYGVLAIIVIEKNKQ